MESLIGSVAEEELPEGGPTLLVTEKQSGASPVLRYAHSTHQQDIFSARDRLVVLVKLGPHSPYDQMDVTEASRTDNSFHIDLDIRNYEGPLAAYDPQIALVQVELGLLAPEEYEVIVTRTRRRFLDPEHPERATDPAVNVWRTSFEVQ